MKEAMRIIEIYAGMEESFEIIMTNAPDEEIEECLRKTYKKGSSDSFAYLTERGFIVEVMGDQDDFKDDPLALDISEAFDIYDYTDGED